MWQRPQVRGSRAWAFEKRCRVWQELQAPIEPSGFTRPMPVFGHVPATGWPSVFGSPVRRTCTVEPWHCLQPRFAAGPPSTISPRTLSSEPMNWAAFAWCDPENSLCSFSWHPLQSAGEGTVATSYPSCFQRSASPAFAWWHDIQPIPFCAWTDCSHCRLQPTAACLRSWQSMHAAVVSSA